MLASWYQKEGLEAGCDEAGRGCLAGPVAAAAVILNLKKPIEGLNDSKKLTAKRRDALRIEIEKHALAWAVSFVEAPEIDEINILNASFVAMHRAIDQLKTRPERLLIDGNRFLPYVDIPHHCIVKGDGKFQSIAAASILAKTHRDELMAKLHISYPNYGWDRNKGYPTSDHRRGIIEFGITPFHRKSFTLLPKQTEIHFPVQ